MSAVRRRLPQRFHLGSRMLLTEIPHIISGRIAGRTEPVPRIWPIFAIGHMVFAPLGYMVVGALIICFLWDGVARSVLHLPVPAIPPLPQMNKTHLLLVLGSLTIFGFRQAVVDLRELLQNGSGYVPLELQFRVLRVGFGYSKSGPNLFRAAGYFCFCGIIGFACLANPLDPHLVTFVVLTVPIELASVVGEIYLPKKIIRELRLELWPRARSAEV